MTFYQSGSGDRCAPTESNQLLSLQDSRRLHAYFAELELTITKLAEHIAELEAALHTMRNEDEVAVEAERLDAASARTGRSTSPASGSMPRSTPDTPIIFRFDPRNAVPIPIRTPLTDPTQAR